MSGRAGRGLRWLVVAVSIVVLAGGCARTLSGSAGATGARPPVGRVSASVSAPAPGPPLAVRDWASVRFPLDCGRFGWQVVSRVFGDVTGDGRPDAVVVVACNAGAGSPPEHIFAYDGASPPGPPRLLATLTAPGLQFVTGLKIVGRTVSGTAYGYSSDRIPRCCPDLRFPVVWEWTGTAFRLVRS